MSDLRFNLGNNARRYRLRKNRAEYVAKMAAYTAISFILYLLGRFFKLPFIFPPFFDIQISEIPALIAGFSIGPWSGCLVIILKCLLKMPFTGTTYVGEATDILLGICFVLPSSLVYNAHRSRRSAAYGLALGTAVLTSMSLVVNRFISIPFYVEVMFGGNWNVLLGMVDTLYDGVTKDTFFTWYLLAGVLPFNLFRCLVVDALTFLLYPRIKKPLRLEIHVEKPTEEETLYREIRNACSDGGVTIYGENGPETFGEIVRKE